MKAMWVAGLKGVLCRKKDACWKVYRHVSVYACSMVQWPEAGARNRWYRPLLQPLATALEGVEGWFLVLSSSVSC
jgi:hypothetical protein